MSNDCPSCGNDTGVEPRSYRGLGAWQFIDCPHCKQLLISDYVDGRFVWEVLQQWSCISAMEGSWQVSFPNVGEGEWKYVCM